MESHIIEKIGKPAVDTSLSKLEAAYPHARVKGRLFTTRVVGVTFEGRQEVVARMRQGDRVWLEPEPDNSYDHNAIKVCRSNGEQVGYINRHLAARLIPHFQAYGYPVRGKVCRLTGGGWEDYSLGVVIAFKLPKPGTSNNPNIDNWED